MEVITRRGAIKRDIAECISRYSGRASDAEMVSAVKQLDPGTCSSEDLATLIGNDSWGRVDCAECGSCDVDAVVELQTSDYDRPLHLCLSCLKAAVQKLEGL